MTEWAGAAEMEWLGRGMGLALSATIMMMHECMRFARECMGFSYCPSLAWVFDLRWEFESEIVECRCYVYLNSSL
jgi:hypothetical protein